MAFPIFDDSTPMDLVIDPKFARGAIPRDFTVDPPEMFQPPAEMNLIARSEWDARIKEQDEQESSLWHMRMRALPGGSRIPSLDQNGQGYCWMYDPVMCIMMDRMKRNQPYVRLSAHAAACKVKNFKDEGGWCGLGAKWLREKGVPDIEHWPEKSMSRSHDKAATWKNAEKHKITSDWVDLARPVYDQNLTFDQVASCLLRNEPCAVDFNWWGHSVCALRLVRVEAGSYGLLILNSWTDAWGNHGCAVLRGSKALPDGAIGIQSSTPG